MQKQRYEFKGGGSNKYWEVEPPFPSAQGNGNWVVRVHFGRIGTAGQIHINVFDAKFRAENYYATKVDEKLGKGYKYVSLISTPPYQKPPFPGGKLNPIVIGTPEIIKKKEKPPCEHNQLRKTGDKKWKCNSCGTQIEFDKPQASTATIAEEVIQVRRFIDLSAFNG